MNRKSTILILLIGLALPYGMQAASYSVFSGQSIQTKIDAASNGDTVAIFGGTYTENLTVSKDVRLQLVAGQTVTLAGNITFSGLSNAYTFANFTWGGQTDKRITVNNCSNFTINGIKSAAGSIDSTGTGNLLINATALTNGYIGVTSSTNTKIIDTSVSGVMSFAGGTKAQVIRSTNGGGTAANSQVDFIRSTVNGNYGSSGNKMSDNVTPSRLSFTRCNMQHISLDSYSGLTYVGYSTLRFFRQLNGGKAYIFGSTIREDSDFEGSGGAHGNTVEVHDSSSLSILNSAVRNGRDNGGYWSNEYRENQAIWVGANAKILAINNIVFDYGGNNASGRAFRLDGSVNNYIASNIGYSIQSEFVYGPFANNTVTYNLSQTGEGGGVLLQNRLNADPAFVDTTDFVLGPTSPARNAGDPDPRFNDVDGTRNDMGIYGGPFYDPEGRAGSKPVVMQMELDQTQFLRGDYSTLKLKAVGSATGTAP
jgi:hypothetical protein